MLIHHWPFVSGINDEVGNLDVTGVDDTEWRTSSYTLAQYVNRNSMAYMPCAAAADMTLSGGERLAYSGSLFTSVQLASSAAPTIASSSGLSFAFWMAAQRTITGNDSRAYPVLRGQFIFELSDAASTGANLNTSYDKKYRICVSSESAQSASFSLYNEYYTRTSLSSFIGSSNPGTNTTTSAEIPNNSWRHFAVTLSATGNQVINKFYINGVLINQITCATQKVASATTGWFFDSSGYNFMLKVGQEGTGAPTPFWLSDVRIYDETLDAATVSAIYVSGVGEFEQSIQGLYETAFVTGASSLNFIGTSAQYKYRLYDPVVAYVKKD